MANETILVVDDEVNTRMGLKTALEEEGYNVLVAATGLQAQQILNEQKINLLITDLKMPGIDGLELLKSTRVLSPETAIILMTGYGSIETAVKAMKDGAYDFITKPIDLDKLSAIVEKSLMSQRLLLENIYLKEKLRNRYQFEQIIGKSRKLRDLFEVVEQVAPTKSTVLLTGESGTGKELFANAVYKLSNRANKPFVKLSCAALSEGVLESEIFGHEKGAFTGAWESKKGRFELANNGTLFLDEIGEISLRTQTKLLRVLQEREFERVGGQKTLKVDVRLIVATNQDLAVSVQEGRFREDLYYRLNVVTIHLPPLRERLEDIPLLIEYFVEAICTENDREVLHVAPEVVDLLSAYAWPGNIRELHNCIESSVVKTRGKTITLTALPSHIQRSTLLMNNKITFSVGASMDEIEREAIIKTLQAVQGNKTMAARILRIGTKTIYRKIAEYDIKDW
ncbi:MAG: sigma-54-dependent Fis family transcriptional regulator [Candidatus Schekmanbacteria bacterium]|nr:sigma-54-dependent Fis family transcriptional regulator [Candidatus Schekmanbacteria bacterium]